MKTDTPDKSEFINLQYERPDEEFLVHTSTELLQTMKKRRSVREFSSDPVPPGVLENIVRTAATAPSGANKQPWFFAIVRNPEIKHLIREAAEKEESLNYERRFSKEMLHDISHLPVDANKPYLEKAPALIVVFKQSYRVDEEGIRRKNYYVNESVGIAAGMLISAIHQCGLVTLTHTPSPMKFLNDILERPHYESAVLLMPVGFPAEGTRVPNLDRKPFGEICKEYR